MELFVTPDTRTDSQSVPPRTAVVRHVEIDPVARYVATWRRWPALPRVDPAPFDQADCVQRFGRISSRRAYYDPFNWEKACLARFQTRQEALFWFAAMTEVDKETPKTTATRLAKWHFSEEISLDEVQHRLRSRARFLSADVLLPLANLFSPVELLDLLLAPETLLPPTTASYGHHVSILADRLTQGFARHVLPWLEPSERDHLGDLLRSRFDPLHWVQTASTNADPPLGYRLAPWLGLHAELLAVVNSWPDNRFPGKNSYDEWRRLPREMIFGLGDPRLVQQHVTRLGLLLRLPVHVQNWLIHTELTGLDYVVASIRAESRNVLTPAGVLGTLCRVKAPELAPHLLALKLDCLSPPALRQWFVEEVGCAVAGLLPLAGGRGRVADAARDYLRSVRRRGFAGVIEEHLGTVSPDVADRVRRLVLEEEIVGIPLLSREEQPGWLVQALRATPFDSLSRVPDWVVPAELPPLVVEGRLLDEETVFALIRVLQQSTLDATPPLLVQAVREFLDLRVREAFVWRLVEGWQSDGLLNRDLWVLTGVAWLGGDDSALKLAGLIRDWTGSSGQKRSSHALDCLAALGSPTAILQLSGLARQLRAVRLKAQAHKLLEDIAGRQSLTRGQLEDLTVPDLGFDARGMRTFDYGPRQFRAQLGMGASLHLRDATGRIRDDLPKPAARDDTRLAEQARADWRSSRKQLRALIKEQTHRLEEAMRSGRAWTPAGYETWLDQPILFQMARVVLWAGWKAHSRPLLFRLTEERTLVDAQETPVSLQGVERVTIIHPIQLTAEERQEWSQVWNDHELIPPFPQLGRPLATLLPDEEQTTEVTRFAGPPIQALTLSGLLKADDWMLATILRDRQRRAHGEVHCKRFESIQLSAILEHRQVGPHAWPYHHALQELSRLTFVPAAPDARGRIDPGQPVRLGEVDLLVRTRVLEVLLLAASKARPRS